MLGDVRTWLPRTFLDHAQLSLFLRNRPRLRFSELSLHTYLTEIKDNVWRSLRCDGRWFLRAELSRLPRGIHREGERRERRQSDFATVVTEHARYATEVAVFSSSLLLDDPTAWGPVCDEQDVCLVAGVVHGQIPPQRQADHHNVVYQVLHMFWCCSIYARRVSDALQS